MTQSISKAELMKLIDERLPDDARIMLFSSMLYETYEIGENIDELFIPVSEAFNGEEDMPEDIGDATYVITGA